MKLLSTIILLLCLSIGTLAQKKAEDFGYKLYQIKFEADTVKILVKSKKGEENKKKPIWFSIAGSRATPLIIHDGQRLIYYASLSEGFVEDKFHLVMVGKPGIPLISHKDSLTKRRVYKDPITKQYPKEYLAKNNLEYYVRRNNAVVDFLKKQKWADTSRIILSGHSQGSSIAAHMADKIPGITHLIYSGGLPYFSRILAMIQKERMMEKNDENPWVQKTLDYWKDVIKYPFALTRNKGWNTNSGTYSFSQNENELLKRLKIPVLICYGTKDEASPFNDMFSIEVIKDKITNITFKAYPGLDHHYRTVKPTSGIAEDNIKTVVTGWLKWIEKN